MGTNYYVLGPTCPHCGHADERLHIGKSSAGWTFSFAAHAGRGLTSWKEWRRFLSTLTPTTVIVDEYGKEVPLGDLVRCVDGRPDGMRDELAMPDSFRDPEGYTFTTREFS